MKVLKTYKKFLSDIIDAESAGTKAKIADIGRRRQESKKLVRNAGSAANGEMKIAIHLSPEGKETDRIAVSTTQTDKNFKVTPKIGWEKEIEDWINAKYDAELKALEQSLKENQSESQENNKISSDEQQRAELEKKM